MLDLCRRHGISDATFYNWKAQIRRNDGGGAAPPERARGGEREARAHRPDQALDIPALKDLVGRYRLPGGYSVGAPRNS